MDKTNIFTKEELQDMNIFRIREISRNIGIESTSSKGKEELIKLYLEKAGNEGQTKPNKGRGKSVKKEIKTTKSTSDNFKQISNEEEPSKIEIKNKIQEKTKNTEKPQNNEEYETKYGLLDVHSDGFGFLRVDNCEYGLKDAYVSSRMIKQLGLRMGDMVEGTAKKNAEGKPSAIVSVLSVNGVEGTDFRKRPMFDNLVPIFPEERLKLEMDATRNDFSIRCIDLIAPIGKGQRAMIVSPPKAGKTTLLKKVANSIATNYPEVELFVLLVDERPEEVTDMQRSIKGEVVYSTFDETPEHHCKAAELLIERAKRNVELGKDVVIIMDSLTRLARAYNLTIPPTGRTLSGGIDPGALHNPKRFFGAARNIEHGGSLTIIATALIDTGSRMDDVIYEEFKGTGNMEIHLDRKLSERRIFPAIDLNKSSTRREDLLLTQKELEGVYTVRKMLSAGDTQDAAESLINMIVKTKTNDEFIENINMQMKIIEKSGFTRTSGK